MSNVIHYMDVFNGLGNQIDTYLNNDENAPLEMISKFLLLEEWRVNESRQNAEIEAWTDNEGGM